MTNEAQPSVLNKHRISADVAATYIGRGSKWGNPFRIGPDGDRAAVIAKHELWLRDQHHLLRQIGELRGRNLVCFCAPAACHGNLLLRLANASREDLIAWWRAAPCDQSGEAGETSGLDPQGESTVTGAARQAPSNPMQEVIAEIVERAGRDPAQAFLRETLARRDAERQSPSDNPLTETKEGSGHARSATGGAA